MATSEANKDKHFPVFALDSPLRKLFDSPTRYCTYVKPDQAVADLSCGPGFYTLALADSVGPNGRIYAVDSDEKAIRALVRKAAKRGYHNIEAHTSSAADLGFIEDASVDFILACGLLCSMAPQASSLCRVVCSWPSARPPETWAMHTAAGRDQHREVYDVETERAAYRGAPKEPDQHQPARQVLRPLPIDASEASQVLRLSWPGCRRSGLRGWPLTIPLAACVRPEGKVYAVELEKKLAQQVREKVEKYGLHNVEVHDTTATDLFFIKDGSVDFVLANGLLCTMPAKRELAVSEIKPIRWREVGAPGEKAKRGEKPISERNASSTRPATPGRTPWPER